jgi:DNA transformation protein and related proteins
MARSSEFIDYVLELVAPLGDVSSRAMFGGYGIYAGSQIIAIVVGDILYLKADEASRGAFDALGLEPFSYTSRGKTYAMSYFRAPDECFDAPHAMLPWARAALAAALRKAARTPQRKRRPQPKPRTLGKTARGR